MGKSTKSESESLKDGAEALSELSADAMNAVRALVKEVRDETLELVQSGRDQVDAIGDATESAITRPSIPVRLHCAGHRMLDRDHTQPAISCPPSIYVAVVDLQRRLRACGRRF